MHLLNDDGWKVMNHDHFSDDARYVNINNYNKYFTQTESGIRKSSGIITSSHNTQLTNYITR